MMPKLLLQRVSLILIGVIFLIVPVAASTVAVYGSTSGFLPERHTDQVSIAYSLPGNTGRLFDENVDYFIDPSTDVIFIGSDDEFSSQTAAAIEQAVWDGKVLVIGFPATGKFGDSLPVMSGGTAEGSKSLTIPSPATGISREVFSGLNRTFVAKKPPAQRLDGTLKPGAITLLKFNTGDPALAYRQYGSGYVVEWMLAAPQVYLGEDCADIVNLRVISILLATVQGAGSPVASTVATTAPATVATSGPVLQDTTPVTGNALIQSSPLGAGVFFDGVYQGKTPLQLQGVPAGYHSVKMTMDGYYDFDGSAYIVRGETITVFGSLPAHERQVTVERTPAVTTLAPIITVAAPPSAPTPDAADSIANPTVIAAGIGIITAGIGAYATIYTHKNKEKK